MADQTNFAPALPPLNTLQSPSSSLRSNTTSQAASFDADIRKQANEFEATFIAALLQPVFEGLAKDSTFGGGFAEETWTGLLTQEYAKSISGTANLGVADQVYDQLIKLQETTTQPGSVNISDARTQD